MVKNQEKSFGGTIAIAWIVSHLFKQNEQNWHFPCEKMKPFCKRRRRRWILQASNAAASKFFKHHAIVFAFNVWVERVDLTTDDLSNWLEGIVFLQRRHDNWFDPNILAKKKSLETHDPRSFLKLPQLLKWPVWLGNDVSEMSDSYQGVFSILILWSLQSSCLKWGILPALENTSVGCEGENLLHAAVW